MKEKVLATDIPIEFGKNLMQVVASYKKKSGYIKINLDDNTINEFFRNYGNQTRGIKVTKKMYLRIEETTETKEENNISLSKEKIPIMKQEDIEKFMDEVKEEHF